MKVFRRTIVVATRLLMVATAYGVVEVAIVIVRIYITHEALAATTLGADGLLLTAPRHAGAVQLIAKICLHDSCVFCSFFVNSRSFVLPPYIRKEEQTHRNMFSARQNGRVTSGLAVIILLFSHSIPSFTI